MNNTNRPKISVSLVLGSGGARGFAHIGVIRTLVANGFVIESIAGSSIGALVGGIYAADKLDDFEQWAVKNTKRDVVSLLDISWGGNGIVKGDKFIRTMVDLLGDRTIESLEINYTAVATELKRRREVWLTQGSLFDAIRASVSLPLFLAPHTLNGVELIDGGVLSPIPIAPTFSDNTDLTIAVDLTGPRSDKNGHQSADNSGKSGLNSVEEKIVGFANRFQAPFSGKSDSDSLSFMDVANESFDAMQESIARQKLAAYPPDEIIAIPIDCCGMLEFFRAQEMIELGVARAEEFVRRYHHTN